MREIKFRAWIVQEERMADEVYDIEFNHGRIKVDHTDLDGTYSYYANIPPKKPRYILMQFIGLKDKNGKEIYEGDILICPDLIERYGQVNYRQEVCSFELLIKEQTSKTSVKFYNYTLDDVTKFEVIGNIHENPELLTT